MVHGSSSIGGSGGDECVGGAGFNWKEQRCSFQLSSRCEAGFRQTAHEENVNDLSDLFTYQTEISVSSCFTVDHF